MLEGFDVAPLLSLLLVVDMAELEAPNPNVTLVRGCTLGSEDELADEKSDELNPPGLV